jgi:excisionase family DNA binding protein
MAQLSVSQAADRLGVNVQRVHQRIADGSLPAERVGHQWAIREADLARLSHRKAGRPLSSKSVWELAQVACDLVAVNDIGVTLVQCNASRSIPAPNRSRARSRLRDLLGLARKQPWARDPESAADDVAAWLRALMRGRAERRLFRASSRDLADLRADHRIKLSGISLPDSGIASGDIVEGYVAAPQLEPLVEDFLLSEARDADANVVLHVIEASPWSARPDDLNAPVESWIVLAADLAEHRRPREVARAAQIVRRAAEETAK